MSQSVVTVDIVSDIVCPWCWLGYRYFQQATEEFDGEVRLNWRPYMLDPDVPTSGVPYKAYMKNKFGDGPSDRFKAMRTHLETAGPDVGIDFKFDGIPMRPNTLNAHRMMRWASGQGKADDVAQRLFAAFFTDHRDVGDMDILVDIAGQAGLDRDLVGELLQTDRDVDAVTEEIMHYRRLGVSGVPSFIYAGQYLMTGAQPKAAHIKALEQMVGSVQNAPT